ncbi:phage tail protein [Erythrobacter tepidarius]|uniref:phage tail protein n=1 Tax=Erythrobacter tepidarius TaxID=60454 RepID=UPI000A3A48F8|nr:phage tail protein [Erythrobacter tepidarius]
MATLLLTALGTAIGGPVGGAIGTLIGQQADAAIFGGGNRQGPRLRELNVSSSSYGQPIPRHFGRMRVPGIVIWSTDLIESKRKQKGRKGQPSITVYSYSASFAVALSSTPVARLGRIWADGHLLRGAQEDLKVGGRLRFYRGFGDDPVDPLIAGDKGASAPAFRDCAYVVFEDLELGDFGNRIPALSFEIFAHGGDTSVSLNHMVPAAVQTADTTIAHIRGFADEGGELASTLAAIDEVIPLVCTSGRDGLRVAPRRLGTDAPVTLPAQLSLRDRAQEEGRHRQRTGLPAREPAALRYYDEERDYQPGVQRALGSRRPGRELMLELPATAFARDARQLANERANRARWQSETMTWRIGELDPRLQPGDMVRVPDTPGTWFVRSWEWLDRGVELVLERVPPGLMAMPAGDPGTVNPPPDQALPQTSLAAFEVPADAATGSSTPLIFAAASAANNAWRGAALYRVQGNTLIALGSSGTVRAVMGTLAEPLGPSPGVMFEPEASLTLDLVAADLSFNDTDLEGLAMGANRLLVGGEAVQFARATPLGERRWRLRGLLRGRAGTEAEATLGHGAQTSVILLDERLIPLDPTDVPPIASTRIAAIGTADAEAVIAPLANAGLSRRPPTPVHPRLLIESSGAWELRWTRRARGHWRWEDGVEVPLVEEQESNLVGYGPTAAPHTAWSLGEARLRLSQEERAGLISAYGPAALWVKQVGTFAHSPALFLAMISSV